jgi:hypothetical protein
VLAGVLCFAHGTRISSTSASVLHRAESGTDTGVLSVGLFVGLFCQPTSGFWRFVAVASRTTESAKLPVNKGHRCNNVMPEEGLEPPTRGL